MKQTCICYEPRMSADEDQRREVDSHVVGPVRVSSKWIFLCPECDSDRLDTQPSQSDTVVQCTKDWLRGELLRGGERTDDRGCYCWETDPYEGEGGAETNNKRRFFHYTTISKLLGGAGKRVDLPLCVKEKVEELYGKSATGFQDSNAEEA